MSWRDRVAQHDPAAGPAADSTTATQPIGTIGAIGNLEFPAIARNGRGTEDFRADHVWPSDLLPDPLAVNGESAGTAANKANANSAESANSAENAFPVAKQCDAESADSSDVGVASWGDGQEERAAIVAHDGQIPRAWAEGFARLDPDQPPADVPPRRWLRFIDDVGAFIDSPFSAAAAALGWGPHDLFGCDRDRPFARIDRAGLLWLLNGDRLVMLADNAASIETRTGVRQTWKRKPGELGRVLAWELAQ